MFAEAATALAGGLGAEAVMNAVPEGQMAAVDAGDVERLGVLVAVRVAVGGGQRDDHLGVGGDDDVAERDVLGGVAERRVRDGSVPAQHLLDRARQQAGSGDQRGALVGVAEQGDRPVADQTGGGVVPGDGELEDRGQDLLLVKRVAFVACPDEVGDQVLARLDAFAVQQLGEVGNDVR